MSEPPIAVEGVIDAVQLETHDGFEEKWINLVVSHAGKQMHMEVAESDRVYDLKASLYSLTNVPPERQKIIGLVKGKLPTDDIAISSLGLTSGKKFTLIGTPEGQEVKHPSELPEGFTEADIDFVKNPQLAVIYLNDMRNQRKVKEATRNLIIGKNLNVMNELREGKNLLVLDLDYTILDTKPLTSGSLPPIECARPGLHAFLEAIYPYYDICIWSQTSWMWLETKLVELGMVGSDQNYQIGFVLDKTSMFPVFSARGGTRLTHHVKPLQVIWNHFHQFSAKNTVHLDDLARNFALNPNEGIKVHAFKNAHTEEASQDRELDLVTRYLVHMARTTDDFTTFSHKDWRKAARELRDRNNQGDSSAS